MVFISDIGRKYGTANPENGSNMGGSENFLFTLTTLNQTVDFWPYAICNMRYAIFIMLRCENHCKVLVLPTVCK